MKIHFYRAFASGVVAAGLCANAVQGAQISAGLAEVGSLLYMNANTVIAGAEGAGVFLSTDQGANWSRSAGIPYCSARSLAKSSATTAYAATECGLYKSVDTGATWTKITSHPTRAVSVSPVNANVIVVGVTGLGVLRSTDAGATFSDASSGLDSTDVRTIAFDPSNASVAYVGLFNPDWYPPNQATPLNLGGVFKSADGGVTWSNFNKPGAGAAISSRWVTSVSVNGSGTVFATTAPSFNPSLGTVQRYNATAGGWESPSTTSPSEAAIYGAHTLQTDPNGVDIWVGSDALGPYVWLQSSNQLRRQMDGAFTSDGIVLNKINALAFSTGSASLLGVAGVGVYRSATVSPSTSLRGYTPWTKATVGIAADRTRAFSRNAVSGASFLGVAGGGVLRAPSGSQAFAFFNAGFAHPAGVSNVFATPTVDFLTTTAAGDVFAAITGRGVLRSSAGNNNWASLTTTNWAATGLAAAPANNEVFAAEFFASPTPGAQKISSAGTTSLVQAGWQAGAGMGRVVKSSSALAKVYALSVDSAGAGSNTLAAGYVLPAAGGSTAMTVANVGFQRLGFYALADSGSTVVASSLKGVYRSTDGGGTFARVQTSGLPSSGIVGLASTGGVFFAVTRKGDVLCSTDVGTSWQAKASGSARAVDIVVDGSNVIVLTDGAGMQSQTTACP